MAVCVAVIGKDVRKISIVEKFYRLCYDNFEQIVKRLELRSLHAVKYCYELNFPPQNSPKYIKCAAEATALQFHYKVHTSIDIIEEKLSVGNKTATDTRELFLGLLFSTEEHKMYVQLCSECRRRRIAV